MNAVLRAAITLVFVLLFGPALASSQQPYELTLDHIETGDTAVLTTAGPSPNGRWIAFTRKESEDGASLWVMPVGGGEPVRVTNQGYFDNWPLWSPSGDRILFVSNRPARAGDSRVYGMVLRFDPATGRAAGPPRQLTLDGIAGSGLSVSPDGQWVAYATRRGDFHLRVIPASGGHPRTLFESEHAFSNIGWSTDAEALHFGLRPFFADLRIAYRIPAQGGAPVEIFRTEKALQAISPDGRHFVTLEPDSDPRTRSFEVMDGESRDLARYVDDFNTTGARFSPDGRTLFGAATNVVAPIRVMPIAGGSPRTITREDYYHWPAGWSADGSAVLVHGVDGDRDAMVIVRRGGGMVQSIAVPEDGERPRWWHASGEHLLYQTGLPGTNRHRLVAVSRADGGSRVLSENFVRPIGQQYVFGRGGTSSYDRGEFLFFERRGDGLDLRAVRGDGSARVVRSFPQGFGLRVAVAVHGDRVAYFESAGDSVHLVLATGPTAAPRRIGTLPTAAACCSAAFSHDGRYIATSYATGMGDESRIAIVEVPAEGSAAAAPRLIATGAAYWYGPQWLPDGSGLTVIAGYAGILTHVLLVPLREGATPVQVTREDPSPKWGHLLSPDGRYVAYPAEIWRGGSVWTVDLGPALATVGGG